LHFNHTEKDKVEVINISLGYMLLRING
jgi:hypothetical protein